MSDFQYYYWLAGHSLSVHIPAVPYMVKECVSNKAADKSRFGPELNEAEIDTLVDTEELLLVECLIKQLFYSGFLDIK